MEKPLVTLALWKAFFTSLTQLASPLPSWVVKGMTVLPSRLMSLNSVNITCGMCATGVERTSLTGAPPHGSADEDGVVLAEVWGSAFVGRQLALVGLFLRQVDKRRIGHAVVLVGDDFVLVGTCDFADIVGHNLGVANLDIAHAIVVARVGEEDDYFILFIALLFDCVIALVFSCLLCALQPLAIRSARTAVRILFIA